jgi:hypothetical protein
MMADATAGCGSGGSDDCSSDDDECGEVEATSINNQSNDDDDDDAKNNPIVMLHQYIVPGGDDYLEGDLGDDSETCDNTQSDSTNGPDEEVTSGMYSDLYNTSIMGRYLKALSRESKFGSGKSKSF